MIDPFETQSLQDAEAVVAPDGSAVRSLCRIADAGSFAHFQLEPGEVAKAVSHATVQEIWYVVAGAGQMWRRQNGEVVPLAVELWRRSMGDQAASSLAGVTAAMVWSSATRRAGR